MAKPFLYTLNSKGEKMIFTVTVTETDVKQARLEIEADDWEQAEEIANQQWQDGLVEFDNEYNDINIESEESEFQND
jgi:hypothetical protein